MKLVFALLLLIGLEGTIYAQSVMSVDSSGNATVTTLTSTTTLAAPFVVSSTMNVAHLNASSLNGQTFTSPTITTPAISGAISFPAGVDQTFNPNAIAPGINIGSYAGSPGTLTNGDLWYNSSANSLEAQINGSTVPLGGGSSGANPSASVGLSAVNGSANTFMRSDAAPPLSQSIAPTWTGLHNWNQAGIGTTTTTAMEMENTTVSTSGTSVQYSPAFVALGHAWNTSGTPADNYSEMKQELRPTSGTSPLETWYWSFYNGSSSTPTWSDEMSLTSAGLLAVSTLNLTNALGVPYGGTGATTAAAAQTNLTPASVSDSGISPAISWTAGLVHRWTLSANATPTFSGYYDGAILTIAVTNTASNYTLTWPTSSPTIKWAGGTQPTQTTGAHTDVWTFVDENGTIYGSVVQNF